MAQTALMIQIKIDKTIDDHVRTENGIDIPNFWDKNAISPNQIYDSIYERIVQEINNGALDASSGNTKKIVFSSAYEPEKESTRF